MDTAFSESPDRIRNICVLAHVDHGKTSLTDSLLSASGYIHSRHAGQLRYMDSREDEQRRGITMKSSAALLLHKYPRSTEDAKSYFINLIDSPGHVDFTGEVESALNVCDGALLVVDVVEGVCAQTITVLRLALNRGIQPVLVLNKIDRLFTELRLEPIDAYRHINTVLEQVNVILGVRDLETIIRAGDAEKEVDGDDDSVLGTATAESHHENEGGSGWSVDVNVTAETRAFAPEHGNVAFASAVDGWAFRLDNFAKLYAKKFGLREEVLKKTLWGDYCINMKTKKIVKIGEKSRRRPGTTITTTTHAGIGSSPSLSSSSKPMFVGFILDNIWAVYETAQSNDPESLEKREKVVKRLALTVPARDYKHRDGHVAVKSMMSSWLPAAETLLDMVIEVLPSPAVAQRRRLDLLWPHRRPTDPNKVENWQRMKDALQSCDPRRDAPLVAFVSKMVSKPKDTKRGKIRQPAKEREPRKVQFKARADYTPSLDPSFLDMDAMNQTESQEAPSLDSQDEMKEEPLVAFTRILSGRVETGREVHVYGPRYSETSGQGHAVAKITNILLLMGRDMNDVEAACAGSLCGLEGLDDVILKTATLSDAPPGKALPLKSRLGGSEQISELVVRVALEPHTPADVKRLQVGMKKLNQADPMVDTYVMESGENVLAVTGELHLERCLVDLRERFAKGVRFHVSAPIVAFRETVSTVGKLVSAQTSNRYVSISMRAKPIPSKFSSALEVDSTGMRMLLSASRENENVMRESQANKQAERLRAILEEDKLLRRELQQKLWAGGPRGFGSNLLLGPLNSCSTASRQITAFRSLFLFETKKDENKEPSMWKLELVNSLITGFQQSTASGPLCEEPLQGVCFVIEEVAFDAEHQPPLEGSDPYGPLSGQIISAVADVCRQALMAASPRLMEAMLRVEIQTTMETLGSVYNVISKRRGRVIREEIKEGASIFEVVALIPVTESFGFAEALRNQTSGNASPQMILSHWEALEQDPLWIPQTEEELEDWSLDDKTVMNNNLAAKLMNRTRRRKGLHVEDRIVEKAEKQRNLKRNK